MYNPNRKPARSIDPFTLLAGYRLNDLMERADRARLRKAGREVTEEPLFSAFAGLSRYS